MKTRLRKWDLREVEEFPGADRPKDIPQKWGWSEMDQKWEYFLPLGVFIYVSANSYILTLINQLQLSYRYLFWRSTCARLDPCNWILYLFDRSQSFCICLPLGTRRYFVLILYFPCPSCENSYFPQFLSVENGTKTMCGHWIRSLLIAASLCSNRTGK